MTPAAKKQVSLLPSQSNPQSPLNVAMDWLTNVGRVVIIFVELIVVSAFLSRFWLDRTNADLSEMLRQQNAILDSTKEFRLEFNTLKNRLKAIESLNKHKNITGAINSLIKSTPPTIFYNNLNIDTTSDQLDTNLSIVAYDNLTMVDFITNLILNPDIDNVTVTKVEKEAKSSYYSLSLSINFKKSFTQT